MLVAVTILVILSTITITTVNVSMDADRIRTGSRQIQSYLEGARDRAIYAQQPRGVRMILDNQNEDANGNGVLDAGEDANGNGVLDTPDTSTVSSLVYIGPPASIEGELFIGQTGRRVHQVIGAESDWGNYSRRRLLRVGTRIQIPKDTGLWYTVIAFHTEDLDNDGNLDPGEDLNGDLILDTYNLDIPSAILARPHHDIRGSALAAAISGLGDSPVSYKLELEPAVLPNQEPVLLPRGIVVDLDFGKYPTLWTSGGQLDVLFSPRGVVTGPIAATGLIHFLLADQQDTIRNLPAVNLDSDGNGVLDEYEQSTGDKRVVTLFTRTGHISTTTVYPNEDTNYNGTLDTGEDLNSNGILDIQNPFYYAETGEEASE